MCFFSFLLFNLDVAIPSPVQLKLNDKPIDIDAAIKKTNVELNNNDAEKDLESEYEDSVPYPESEDDFSESKSYENVVETSPVASTTESTVTNGSDETEANVVEGEIKGETTLSSELKSTESTIIVEEQNASKLPEIVAVETKKDDTSAEKNTEEEKNSENVPIVETKLENESSCIEKDEKSAVEEPKSTATLEETATPATQVAVQQNDDAVVNSGASTSNASEAKDDTKAADTKKTPKRQKKRAANSPKKSNPKEKLEDYSKFNDYNVNVSPKQRRYFLETRARNVEMPADNCEIFCSNIPINVLESELIPLFERFGKIWELRLLMAERNPNRNAGFAFVRFTTSEAATEAVTKLNDYQIVPGKLLSVRLSQPNLSLFVGNIHRNRTREEIHKKLESLTNGLIRTTVKSSYYEETKNCGFCFLEYDSHSSAYEAKKFLRQNKVWGRHLFVDWTQRRQTPDEESLKESKTVFINNLPKTVTSEKIKELMESYGAVERVTQIKDYAFVLFTEHDTAVAAVDGLDKTQLGTNIEISLAAPKPMKMYKPTGPFVQPFNYHRQTHNNYNRYPYNYNNFNKYRTSQRFGSTMKMGMRRKRNNSDNTSNVASGSGVGTSEPQQQTVQQN